MFLFFNDCGHHYLFSQAINHVTPRSSVTVSTMSLPVWRSWNNSHQKDVPNWRSRGSCGPLLRQVHGALIYTYHLFDVLSRKYLTLVSLYVNMSEDFKHFGIFFPISSLIKWFLMSFPTHLMLNLLRHLRFRSWRSRRPGSGRGAPSWELRVMGRTWAVCWNYYKNTRLWLESYSLTARCYRCVCLYLCIICVWHQRTSTWKIFRSLSVYNTGKYMTAPPVFSRTP